MRQLLSILLKCVLGILAIPIIYLLVSYILTIIPVEEIVSNHPRSHTIYLATNGVHADLILPKMTIDPLILEGQVFRPEDQFFAFGWGEENFYINTPTWGDLTFSTAFRAAFLDSRTLVHVTRYKQKRASWIPIKVTDDQLEKLNEYVLNTFNRPEGFVQLVKGATYTATRDNFYRAHGNYMFYRTCNSWLNEGLKESGLKGSLWTPFDFGVLRWYR